MNTFVFRNNTIEPFFPSKGYEFSGYDDISYVPHDFERYLWWYQMPLSPDTSKLASEINGYLEKLDLVLSIIGDEKLFIAFTIGRTEYINIVENDRKLNSSIDQYNNTLYSYATERANFKVIDIAEFHSDFGSDELVDLKFWFISQMVMSPKLAKPFKKWYEGKLRGIEMKRKKCLVLDLDNTLWDGILGEDGIAGIKIGGDYPGKAFEWWQKALAELSETGVILAACSKNNEKDVIDAWSNNPFIILKDDYFSAYRINWQDKATNIRELASELNIGLDSMVFVDDNPTERELIRQLLPMVAVPEFPEQPYMLPVFFKEIVSEYFQVYGLTKEDIEKTSQYKANADRARAQKSFSNFDDFLKSLEIVIKIEAANRFNIPRIAQMTQKTNQFNLTTKRYTESDIQGFVRDGWKIRCISVSDKFGNNGITGCIMIDNKNNIDSLLLSCRILGKGIEKAFVTSILNLLKSEGVEKITASYIPSAKNHQVKDFYDSIGFSLYEEVDGVKKYIMNIGESDFTIEDYYKIENHGK